MMRPVEYGEAFRKSKRDAWALFFVTGALMGVILSAFLRYY